MLDSVASVLAELHFQYTEQFLVALLPMAMTVWVHAIGMGASGRCFRRFTPHHRRIEHRLLTTTAIVAIMLASHFIEVTLWALFYVLTGMMPAYKTAMFFSVNAYTTLGASNLSLPGRWQGLDGFEAMTAMLMFGWSTALLASVVQKLHGIDNVD